MFKYPDVHAKMKRPDLMRPISNMKKSKGIPRKYLKRALATGVILMVFYLIIPLPHPLFRNDYSTVVVDEQGNILRAFLNHDQQWCFPPDPGFKMPKKLETCILNFEDRYFYLHPGINPVSLLKALVRNVLSRKVSSGASTISMQVIRLAFGRKRTIPNKLLEILQTIKLELHYSKSEILHMYVNHAPYGGNLIGYGAAVQKYFQKRADQLTWSQAAMLAVLPNSPGLISPVVNRQKLKKKRNVLLETLLERKSINRETYNTSIREPLPRDFSHFFVLAPHLAQTLISRHNLQSKIIKTTISRNIQSRAENLLRHHLNSLRPKGISNGAALVVENQTREVKAYVGSNDFFDLESGGQNDGVMAPRSTGSILKPFLYALAMDEGLVLSQTLIKDIPSHFGSFSPSNANRKYSGLVTVKEALIRSLNVPASRVLNTYGLHKFYLFLERAGMTTLFRRPDEYGLTLILGGAESTLFDLATLYCGLASGGTFSPLKILVSNQTPVESGKPSLISPESCHLTLQILKELKRPGAEFYWQQYTNQTPIAWKTGTSYGQRDAWSVGANPQWTIAIWIGNFSGEGNPNLSGASCAAPVMFDIFNLLPKSPGQNWFRSKNLNLKPVKLCMDTGFIAGPNCNRTIRASAPPSVRSLATCPYHRSLFTTLDEKFQVCSLCWQTGNTKKTQHLIFPPDVTQFLRDKGMILSAIPPHKPDCPGYSKNQDLQIIYPVQNAKIWIPRDFDGRLQKLTLKIAHRNKDISVFWYLDDIYQGCTRNRHKMAFQLREGWHRLEVVDSEGNRDQKKFHVSIRSGER